MLDDTGDRKDDGATTHVARQYLGSVGKINRSILAVTNLWTGERYYYPLHAEPYTPTKRLPEGKANPALRTKPQLARALIERVQAARVPVRAVVADCFYGDHGELARALAEHKIRLNQSYHMALLDTQLCVTSPCLIFFSPDDAFRKPML